MEPGWGFVISIHHDFFTRRGVRLESVYAELNASTGAALAYSSPGGAAWKILPVSALLELTAVCLFVVNIGLTMAQRIPAWFGTGGIAPQMPVYFYVASFPKTRPVLQDAGLITLAYAHEIPHTLTLAEAAAADRADLDRVLGALRDFFADRRPRRQRNT